MADKNILIKDKDGNSLYPKTQANIVFTSDGTNVETALNGKVGLANAETISGTKTFRAETKVESSAWNKGLLVNRTTSGGAYVRFGNSNGVLGAIGLGSNTVPTWLNKDNTSTNVLVRGGAFATPSVGDTETPIYVNSSGIATPCTGVAKVSDIPDTTNLATKDELATKQDVLTAGDNITIENGVISSTGGGGLSIGQIIQVTATENYVPEGTLYCDGAERTASEFQQLWDNWLVTGITTTETDWNVVNVGSSAFNGITYGNGKFIAVSFAGDIATSTDGVTWNTATSLDSGMWRITYGNGKFVAVGNSGRIAISTDGVTWNTATVGSSTWQGITFVDDKFIAVSFAGDIATSTDGVTWNTVNVNSIVWRNATYGNGKYVVVGQYGDIGISTDCTNWTTTTIGFNNLFNVIFANGKFVAVGNSGRIAISTDGVTWNTATVGSKNLLSIEYGNGKFVVGDNAGNITTSLDGETWETPIAVSSGAWNAITYGNGKFVAVGDGGRIANKIYKQEIVSNISVCTFEEYQTELTMTGSCYKWAVDTVNEKFRIPFIPDKEFERFLVEKKEPTDADPTWYNLYSDGWCEQGGCSSVATATTTITLLKSYANANYSLSMTGSVGYPWVTSRTVSSFVADTSTAATVNWETKGYIYFNVEKTIRHFAVVSNGSIKESQRDWSKFESGLVGKANTDLSNVTQTSGLRRLVEVSDYSLMPSWYKVFEETNPTTGEVRRWCEQGAYFTPSGTSATVSFLVEYNSSPLVHANEASTGTSTDTEGYADVVGVANISTTSFRVSCVKSRTLYWEAKGYIL